MRLKHCCNAIASLVRCGGKPNLHEESMTCAFKGIAMTYPLSSSVPRGFEHRKSQISEAFTRALDVFAVLGAALRAARAVEAHRNPAAEDLQILGIRNPLPKSW
jgi:hypothetical protein